MYLPQNTARIEGEQQRCHDFELEALIADLALKESVPHLAAFRYTEAGLRKRTQWEETWEKQRREDAIDAEVAAKRSESLWAVAANLHRFAR